MINQIGEFGGVYLAEISDKIIKRAINIPAYWADGRMKLLKKTNSVKGNLLTYRPITVSALVYRIFARIINEKIQN